LYAVVGGGVAATVVGGGRGCVLKQPKFRSKTHTQVNKNKNPPS